MWQPASAPLCALRDNSSASPPPYVVVPSRILVRSPVPFFVNPAGSDSNSGLSVGQPLKTRQKLWDVVQQNYDLGGLPVGIIAYMAAANFDDPFTALGRLSGARNASSFIWQGIGSAGVNMTAAGQLGWAAGDGAEYRVMDQSLTVSGAGGIGILVGEGKVEFGGIVFGNCGQAQISLASPKASVKYISPIILAGIAPRFIVIEDGAWADLTNAEISAWSGAQYTDVAVLSDGGGFLEALGLHVSGATVTGVKFRDETNGEIFTGLGPTAPNLPGNAPGTILSGGQVW